MFKNSKLIELGSGSGQNTLVFDTMGADCTLVEYDKNSYLNSIKLFKKYAKNQYNIINKDLFKFKTKKKYDIVVSNGVAHHTVNPKKNLDICCKLLKKEGFLLIGICLKSGWFQRNLQRAILYNLSENKNDSGNPVLTFEGKKYLINELSKDIKESIKGLQIAETQLKMYEDTLRLLSISRNSLANQLREKLKKLD